MFQFLTNLNQLINTYILINSFAMASYFRRSYNKIKEKSQRSRWKRPLLISAAVIVVFVGIVILFVSPITKYMVEKYDYKYTGREIKMDRAYVNPFTGFIKFTNFRIYENNSDSIFFSATDLSININLHKLLFKTYEISQLTINKPFVKVIQNRKNFNFNDLMTKFSDKKDSTKVSIPKAEPVHFNILNVKIKNGTFYYNETAIPIDYSIIKVNIESSGKKWDTDSITSRFSFASGIGSGDVKGDLMVNLKNMNYRMATVIQKFDLNILGQYLKDLSNYGSFRASMDANLKSSGNFNSVDSITTSGMLSIKDFHFGKNPDEDYVSFDTLTIAMKEVSPMNQKFFFDSISVRHPYFKYERYDSLDNIETMFGKAGSKITNMKADKTKFNLVIEIADYIRQLSKNFFRSDFLINKFAIYNANLRFEDYSISERFAMALNPFSVVAHSIDKNKNRATVYVKSGIEPYGEMNVVIGLYPKDTSNFDIQYHLNKISATMFNPYLISQTSFPLDRGTLELNGSWKVRNSKIDSENHLVIIDPRLTKRIKNKLIKWIPMRIIMAFVRERGNVIDYQIPITGDLNDPKFHIHDVIFDAIKNIFVKPVTTAYRMEVKTVETRIEKSLSLKWDMRVASLGSNEERFIKSMVEFLNKNHDATIRVTPQYYDMKEKEYILFYEAKKKYFAALHNLPNTLKKPLPVDRDDSLMIDKMSVKNPMFVKYLNSHNKDSLLFTIQEKCSQLVDQNVVEKKYQQLKKARAEKFLAHFKDKGLDKRVKIAKGENIVPYNGFSYYKIDYEGEFPEFLMKAYQKMNKLNNEPPRKKFKEERS